MSNAVLNTVFTFSVSKGLDRLVLVAIADRADDEGCAWCGTEDIAKRAGIARNHVTRHTKNLAAMGELEVGFRQGEKNANLYRILTRPTMGQSQDGTVPPWGAACPTMVQNPSQGGTQTPRTPKNPNSAKNQNRASALPFDSQEFKTAWDDFLTHRKQKRKPVTPQSFKSLAGKLRDMGEPAAVLALKASVENGWTGVFAPKATESEKPRYCPLGRPLNDAARRAVAARQKGGL